MEFNNLQEYQQEIIRRYQNYSVVRQDIANGDILLNYMCDMRQVGQVIVHPDGKEEYKIY